MYVDYTVATVLIYFIYRTAGVGDPNASKDTFFLYSFMFSFSLHFLPSGGESLDFTEFLKTVVYLNYVYK